MENNSALNCTGIYYDQQFIILAIVNAASAGVSLLTCLCAISVIILFKKWQSFGQRLLLYLMATVATFSLVQTLRRVDFDDNLSTSDYRFCAFTGYAAETVAWLEIDAIVAVTFYLLVGIIWRKCTDKYEVVYFLFIFAFPFAFTWIPFVRNLYGLSGPWCWIMLVDTSTCERILLGQVLQVVMYYGPQFLLLPAIILAYLAILCALRRRSRNPGNWTATRHGVDRHTSEVLKSETRYLLAYPILYFLFFIPLIVVRVQSWAQPTNLVVPLWFLGGISVNLHGAAMSLAFLLERDTRRRLAWTHLRATVRDYNSTKGVKEFTLRGEEKEKEEEEEEEEEEGGYKHGKVAYTWLTDESLTESKTEISSTLKD